MGRWWTLLAVCLGTFMLLVDVTIVNVALPAIEEDLGSAFEDLQWVIDAYALTLAAALLAGGSLADLLGRRRIYVIGVALFTFASLLCGLAGSPLMLNLARGLQGVGAGLMFACSLALLANTYRGKDRGTAFGIWGATTGAAVAIGPLAGGILTDLIGWEAIFFVNLPIGAARGGADAALRRRVAQRARGRDRRARARPVLRRAGRARVRPDPRQRRGLHLAADPHAADRLRRAAGRVRVRAAHRQVSDVRSEPLPRAHVRRRADRRLRAERGDVRLASCT